MCDEEEGKEDGHRNRQWAREALCTGGAHLFRYSQTPKHTVPQHITLYENNYACVTTLHRNIKTGHIFEIIYYFVTKVII